MPLRKLSAAARGAAPSEASATEVSNGVELLLPSEQAAATLAPTGGASASSRSGQYWQSSSSTKEQDEAPARVYRWTEFFGKEQITEFPASHFDLEGHFESNSSAGHKEFQDRIRAIHFRREGKQKAEIAKILGRPEKFVAKWWQKEEKEVPRPWGVHEYLSKELGQKTFQKHTDLEEVDDRIAVSTASWWRDVEVRRKYGMDPAIYDELLQNSDWIAGVARTRDFSTGASHVRYDKDGKLRLQSHQNAKYKQGQSPAFDKLLQKFFAEYGLADRTSGIALNWYPDGDSNLGSHRHDCWTALFSFGAERILTIDKTPVLCQDGDLVIFGTQRHGVPFMPEVKEGRITVPIFFYPDHMQMQKQWQTLTDPEDVRASRALSRMEANHDISSNAWDGALWSEPSRAAMLLQLTQLGFGEYMVKAALVAQKFDADAAAEMLLMAGAGQTEEAGDIAVALGQEPCECGTSEATLAADAMLGSSAAASSTGATDDDLAAILAAQLEEEDVGPDPSLLEAQFQEYEEQFRHDAAEEWHGHGDLMQSAFVRETLSMSNMDKTTCYSVGHGQMPEKDFYELLSLHSIRVLYDFRPTDYRGDVYTPSKWTSVRSLRSSCKARGISYKHVALGRESAYGILAHIASDEAQHALIELVWHAKRKHTAFLGHEVEWKSDPRQVIAAELQKFGHTVQHIGSSGELEAHAIENGQFPDFIVQEEAKLRTLEKMRQAGELQRPTKSAVDRSTEVIAARLDRPPEVLDAMEELRAAGNQRELVQVQNKLARVQRIAEKKMGLANRVLENTPQWVLDEAKEQEAWIAKRKAEKAAKEVAPSKAPVDAEVATEGKASSSTPSVEETLLVECATCGKAVAWAALVGGDGHCEGCRASSSQPQQQEDLLVECSSCATPTPWSILALADGVCAECSRLTEVQDTTVLAASQLVPVVEAATQEACSMGGSGSSGGWRARRREAQKAAAAAACA
mmetsp:Transcript_57571/g.106375  ORF Transcript_57571/g.106375 Transcript_57571/m.106375 type:complete len:970 (-) Transcript_57571:89-2998(-)